MELENTCLKNPYFHKGSNVQVMLNGCSSVIILTLHLLSPLHYTVRQWHPISTSGGKLNKRDILPYHSVKRHPDCYTSLDQTPLFNFITFMNKGLFRTAYILASCIHYAVTVLLRTQLLTITKYYLPLPHFLTMTWSILMFVLSRPWRYMCGYVSQICNSSTFP